MNKLFEHVNPCQKITSIMHVKKLLMNMNSVDTENNYCVFSIPCAVYIHYNSIL